jgi:hypothetical protein
MNVTDTGVPVTAVIDTVKDAITAARISTIDEERRLRVTAIRLTLHAVATSSTGYKVELKIPFVGMTLKLGTAVTVTDTQTVDIALVPPDLAPRHEIRTADVDQLLVSAIETVAQVTAHAADGNDGFLLKESTITLALAVTRDGSISVVGEGTNQDDLVHTLAITLQQVALPDVADNGA